jgi:hypothetical protein
MTEPKNIEKIPSRFRRTKREYDDKTKKRIVDLYTSYGLTIRTLQIRYRSTMSEHDIRAILGEANVEIKQHYSYPIDP